MGTCMTLHKTRSVVPRPSCAFQWILSVLEDGVAARIIESYLELEGAQKDDQVPTASSLQDYKKINHMTKNVQMKMLFLCFCFHSYNCVTKYHFSEASGKPMRL